jgi:lysophospholipase L1-like esterase
MVMWRDDRIDGVSVVQELAYWLRAVLASGLVALALAELVLRAAGLPTGAMRRASAEYDLDGEVPGPYRPGAKLAIAWPPETAYRVSFNSWGMRGPEPRDDGNSRILALGDSQTFGLGVEDDQTWPARLDEQLAGEGRPHPVLNLASPHLLIDDEIRYLDDVLPVYRPQVVVWMMPSFGHPAEELSRGETPHERSLRRERRSRERWGAWFADSALREARDWAYLWRERFTRAARGEVLAAPAHAALDDAPWRQPGKEHFLARLPELQQLVERAGAKLLLVPHPQLVVEKGRVSFAPPWVLSVARERGIPVVDLHAAFSTFPDPNALLQMPWDTHFSAVGTDEIARAIRAELDRLGWLEPAAQAAARIRPRVAAPGAARS